MKYLKKYAAFLLLLSLFSLFPGCSRDQNLQLLDDFYRAFCVYPDDELCAWALPEDEGPFTVLAAAGGERQVCFLIEVDLDQPSRLNRPGGMACKAGTIAPEETLGHTFTQLDALYPGLPGGGGAQIRTVDERPGVLLVSFWCEHPLAGRDVTLLFDDLLHHDEDTGESETLLHGPLLLHWTAQTQRV